MPTSRRNVEDIQMCFDLFSKHVKLYPIRSATTRTCSNPTTSNTAPIRKLLYQTVLPRSPRLNGNKPYRGKILRGQPKRALYARAKYIFQNILSRVWVTKTRVWIGESVYWIFTSRNYN
jgi:hypothetical protein